MRGSLWKSSLVAALALVGCGKGVVPTVAPIAPPRPNSTRVNRQDVQPIPNKEHRAHKNQNSNSNSSSSGECTQWNQTVNTSNATTGAYEQTYVCASGGSVASYDTVGTFLNGAGSWTETITNRDGSTLVWTGVQSTEANGSIDDNASDNLGDTLKGNYVYNADGSTTSKETWTYVGQGTFQLNGTYSANGAFNGTETFSDPAHPDYQYSSQISTAADGSQTYVVQESWTGWTDAYTLVAHADGSMSYSFKTDDLSTQVSPDYVGQYNYNADGSGTGGYTQSYDDGSQLVVSDTINADSTWSESWKYNGAPPASTLQQTGSINYAADGSGSGSEVNYLANGQSQTCPVTVAADGTFTVGACQ
jgi:hypothetical protein